MALVIRIKARAARQVHIAAQWWSENRHDAPGAIGADVKGALDALSEQPGIGSRVENARDPQTRRLYLARTKYFLYYRIKGPFLDIVAFWHASREHQPNL